MKYINFFFFFSLSLAAANLLIDQNTQRLKVADFGCAELLEECHLGPYFRGNEKAGTLAYNPPEVCSLYLTICNSPE